MAGEPIITVVGNLTADPEVRFTGSGDAVANFTVAQTPRVKDGDEWADGTPTFFRCTAWRKLAENVAESLRKGQQVIVQGGLATELWEDREGNERSSLTLRADVVGPSLQFATAEVTKASGGGGNRGGGRGGGQRKSSGGDAWGSAPDYGDY